MENKGREGGNSLKSEILVQGAKNEALQIISATLLTDREVVVRNIPDILDVNNLIDLLRNMGVKVKRPTRDTCVFQADNVNLDYIKSEQFLEKSRALRGSVLLVGPLISRFGYAIFPKPGGDKIGRRRLDTHLVGIQALGATCDYHSDMQAYELTASRLSGTPRL